MEIWQILLVALTPAVLVILSYLLWRLLRWWSRRQWERNAERAIKRAEDLIARINKEYNL